MTTPTTITIEQLNVTVTVEGGDAAEVAFLKLFNPAVNRWWREVLARTRQDTRTSEDRSLLPSSRERR
jgi:hypothetical protein